MKLLFPISSNTRFYLEEAGYRYYEYAVSKDTYVVINTETKVAESSFIDPEYKSRLCYIPKVCIDGRMLKQAELLAGLGLRNRDVAEILRNQEDLFIDQVRGGDVFTL